MKRTTRKPPITPPLALALLGAALAANAAVPLRWTVETSRVQPASFEAYQGETLTFEAALQSYGKPISNDLQGARIYWQTNGMGSAYWSASASAEGNVLRATWTPAMDVGARAYNCFIGAPSNSYRAAFQLRLRPSPGATPNALPLPTPVIDFATVEVANAPWLEEESDPEFRAFRSNGGTFGGYDADLNLVNGLDLLKFQIDRNEPYTLNEILGNYIDRRAQAGEQSVYSQINANGGLYVPSWGMLFSEGDGRMQTIDGLVSSKVGSATNQLDTLIRTDLSIEFDGRISSATSGLASVEYVSSSISATDPTFLNAVLAVGLNIDTNSVAVLNEIADTFGGFPIEGTATTVGGLLAALAAAVAWLKKNKANQSDVDALAEKVDTANAALEEVA